MNDFSRASRDYFSRSLMTPMRVIGSDDREQIDLRAAIEHIQGLGLNDRLDRAPPDAEKLIGNDGRIQPGVLERTLYPWVRICRIRMRCPDRSGVPSPHHCIGTGWFAGPRTIITAGHVVYDNDWPGWTDTRPAWGAAADVWIGYHNGTALAHTLSTDFRIASAWQDYLEDGPDAGFKRLQLDLGCIQLSEPLSDVAQYFDVVALRDADFGERTVTVSGYPNDRENAQVLYSGNGPTGGLSGAIFYHHADTGEGQSGGPVWLHETGAQPKVVGIHTGGDLSEQRNWAVRITPEVKALIAQWVAENP